MINLLRTTAMSVALVALAGTAGAQSDSGGNSANTADQTAASQTVCNTPWANVDGNEDGFVSRDEASGAVDRQFGQLDADGNDEITKTEWVDCLSSNRDSASAETDRSEENFAEADANRDQGIDPSEYRDQVEQSYRAFHQDQSETAEADSSTATDNSSQDSASASTTDDGPIIVLRRFVWLTPQEAEDSQAMRSMSEDEVAGRAAANFSALDADGNGTLDMQEWSKRSTASAMSEGQVNARFDELDADSNDAISRSELTSAQEMRDEETTASTTADTSASSSSNSSASAASGSGQSDTSDQTTENSDSVGANTPVFFYHFMPL